MTNIGPQNAYHSIFPSFWLGANLKLKNSVYPTVKQLLEEEEEQKERWIYIFTKGINATENAKKLSRIRTWFAEFICHLKYTEYTKRKNLLSSRCILQTQRTGLSLRYLTPLQRRSWFIQLPYLQALIFSGGARYITWRMRRPFLEECRRGSRHFWNHRARVGYGPVHGSHYKKGHVPYSRVPRVLDKCRVIGGARGVMVIVVGNGHKHTSSNPGRVWMHFTKH